MKHSAGAICVLALIIAASPLHPQENAAPPASQAARENPALPESDLLLAEPAPGGGTLSGGGQAFAVLRMVLVLALAAAAIYGVVFFLRKSARPQASADPRLKILTSAHLGSNRYVYVVAVGSAAWLIGAGEGGVSLIAPVEDQETVDAMLLEESRRSGESAASRFAGFRAMLARLGGGGKGEAPLFSADLLRRQRERLKDLQA